MHGAHSSDLGGSATGSEARIHLPIEGQTAWPFILCLIAFGSVVTVGILTILLMVIIPAEAQAFDPALLLTGMVAFVLLEIFIVRYGVIPRNGDYGRYRIVQGRVDLYPLSFLGLKILTEPTGIPMEDYSGVVIESAKDKRYGDSFAVTLAHPKRACMVRIRRFSTLVDAENYARALAEILSLTARI